MTPRRCGCSGPRRALDTNAAPRAPSRRGAGVGRMRLASPAGRREPPRRLLTETADTKLGQAVSAADRDREDESGIYALPAGKGRLCRTGRPRARGGALARRAVLHLACRQHRVPPARGALECRRARRARADAARRQRHQGVGPDPRRLRCAPQHRGSPLQPVPEPRLQTARLPHPFQAAEPSDAQQVLHRGHADHDRGGRNVGDEYFGAGEGTLFVDLDVVAVGRVAGEVAAAFDLYWNSDSAYPADRIVGKPAPDGVDGPEGAFRRGSLVSRSRRIHPGHPGDPAGRILPRARTSIRLVVCGAPLRPAGKDAGRDGEGRPATGRSEARGRRAPTRAGHRLPVLRAGKDGYEESFRLPGEWDQAAHRHQLVCGDGCRRGPCRVREAP